MRRLVVILGAVLCVGALSGVAAYDNARPQVLDWREIAWPLPRDGWPAGRAFRCGGSCDGDIELYVRPKIGFCNCDSGVADDDEVPDRDLDPASVFPHCVFRPLRPFNNHLRVAYFVIRRWSARRHLPASCKINCMFRLKR